MAGATAQSAAAQSSRGSVRRAVVIGNLLVKVDHKHAGTGWPETGQPCPDWVRVAAVRRTALVLALAAALVAGCGGGDEEGGSGSEDGANTNEALACVQDAGLKALATAGDEPLGITGALRISVPPENRITADFFEDADQASDYADGQAAFLEPTGGVSEVVGETVVVGTARAGSDRELALVKGCVN